MLKFQRNYRAEFEIGDIPNGAGALGQYIPRETIIISYPFSCQFDISTGIYTSSNRGIFQFINLSYSDQAALWLDAYNKGDKYIYMKFYAGYGDNLILCFEGSVFQCTTSKQGGSTEYITQMQVYDGGAIFEYGYLNATFSKGTTLSDILKVATQGLNNIKIGYITPEIKPLLRNRTYIGQPVELLSQEYSGYNFFVQNGEINVLGNRDVIPGEVQVISDESGLLGSPKRGDAYVEWDMIFEPQLKAGQAVSLISYTLSWLNQAYQIIQVRHKGIISPVVCGSLITTVTASVADGSINELKKEPETTYKAQPTKGQWLKPVQGQVSSPYGRRVKPTAGASEIHKGMDIACPLNSSVIAPANGRVFFAGTLGGYGYCIQIDHGEINGRKVTSLYGHLNQFLVNQGQTVTQGQQIALSGGAKGTKGAGVSTGPHLHFGVYENEIAVNPTKYIGTY